MSTIKPDSTHWVAVFNVLLGGIATALHVGKATIALPELQTQFNRSLEELSWVISAFPFVAVFTGMFAGALVHRWADWRMLMFGLMIISAASFVGGIQHHFAGLIISRFIEGFGFVIVVVAAPAVLNRIVVPSQFSIVSGLWSSFMPTGIAISMVVSPHLAGWQQSWQYGSALTLLSALLIPLTTPRGIVKSNRLCLHQALGRILRARQPLLLALMFTAYNLQFFSVMSFLPMFLMQRLNLSLAAAGSISSAAVAVNIIGNIGAGLLLSHGLRSRSLLAVTSVLIGGIGGCIFLQITPNSLLIPLCFLFCAIAGILPATILASTPTATPELTLLPLSLGLVMQGNYLGQVIAPIALSAIVASDGWAATTWLLLAAAVLGMLLALIFSGSGTPPRVIPE